MASALAVKRTRAAARDVTAMTVFQASRLLQAADVGHSEWYLYVWLVSLANATRATVLRTNITAVARDGVETPHGHVAATKMSLNTVKSALSHLEEAGLIEVTRTKEWVTVHLDIKFL